MSLIIKQSQILKTLNVSFLFPTTGFSQLYHLGSSFPLDTLIITNSSLRLHIVCLSQLLEGFFQVLKNSVLFILKRQFHVQFKVSSLPYYPQGKLEWWL